MPSAATVPTTDGSDLSRAPRRLVAAVIGSLVAAVLVELALLALVNRAEWWRGLLAATTASALAAAMSLPPLLLSFRRGALYGIVAAYFAAAGARLIISLGGCLLAVMLGDYPAVPTLVLMVPLYFAVLAAETTVVARAIWNLKG